MFTIKLFYDNYSYNVLSAPHYNIYRNTETGVTEITLYKDHSSQNGTTYKVSGKPLQVPHWDYAFIENSSGKTIDHIR